MRFPSPQPCWPGYGKRAVACGSVLRVALNQANAVTGRVAARPVGKHAPPRDANQHGFFGPLICSDLRWFACVLQCFPKIGKAWFAVICRVQINANQRIEKLRKRELANQVICIDLHPIYRFHTPRKCSQLLIFSYILMVLWWFSCKWRHTFS